MGTASTQATRHRCDVVRAKKRNFADFDFSLWSTAIIISPAISQSAISGFAPGPVRGARRSASCNIGTGSFTNSETSVPSVARLPILGTYCGLGFLVATET